MEKLDIRQNKNLLDRYHNEKCKNAARIIVDIIEKVGKDSEIQKQINQNAKRNGVSATQQYQKGMEFAAMIVLDYIQDN